ncbi:MAG TPA: hypothetical protein DEP45_15075 [Armatimonadetes bacterium]|nr:hypothetical protein [Armatimonadota bacterium]
MVDGGDNVPEVGREQPDTMDLHTAPASPQAASYLATASDDLRGSARSSRSMCLVIGLVGCGCLLVALVMLGVIGGFTWSIFGGEKGPTPVNEIEEPGPATGLFGPGSEAALAWAGSQRPDWTVSLDDNSEDWSRVRLLMAPPGSEEMTTWVELQWDAEAGGYKMLDEGPIGFDGAQRQAPESSSPGEEAAKQAARGYIEQPDWVARVDSHSEDWHRVTVSLGPPDSEYVYVVTLQWDDSTDSYAMTSMDEIDYPAI